MKNVSYNFLGIPDIPAKKARFAILPVPFEATTSCLPGTKDGPSAIIAASNYVELFDEELKTEPYLQGIKTFPDVPVSYKSLKSMIDVIKTKTAACAEKGTVTVALGGEHTVSLGVVSALGKQFPEMNILSLDAHADLRDEYQGTKYSHACVMKRIVELSHKTYIAGVRSISKEEYSFVNSTEKAEVMFACNMERNWEESLNEALPSGQYYLSFDLDFLDPSIMPETGTPEPGGFLWNETINFLRQFVGRKDVEIIGFDVVELAPGKSVTPSSFLAAKLVYKLIGFIGENKNL